MNEVFSCPTNKMTFDSYNDAKDKIVSLSNRKKKGKYTPYKCNVCEKYHITTTTKKLRPVDYKPKYKHTVMPPPRKKEKPLVVNPPKPRLQNDTPRVHTSKIMSKEQADFLKRLIENGNQ